MNIYESLIIAIFFMIAIMMVIQFLDSSTPKLADILAIVNIFPCYQVIVYRNGKRIKRTEWFEYLTSSVHYSEFKDGILYISID